MSGNLVDQMAAAVAPELNPLQELGEEDLFSKIDQWLEEVAGTDALRASDRPAALKEWFSRSVLPALRRAGTAGQESLECLQDPDSTLNAHRIAAILLVLAVPCGLQVLDVSTAVAIIVLLIRMKSRET